MSIRATVTVMGCHWKRPSGYYKGSGHSQIFPSQTLSPMEHQPSHLTACASVSSSLKCKYIGTVTGIRVCSGRLVVGCDQAPRESSHGVLAEKHATSNHVENEDHSSWSLGVTWRSCCHSKRTRAAIISYYCFSSYNKQAYPSQHCCEH